MALKTQTDERDVTVSKAETLAIPAASPYVVRLEEVPDSGHGVEIRRVGPASKTGTGSGSCTSGGIYSGATTKMITVTIDGAGDVGAATFKWHDGTSWRGTLLPISDTDPIELEMGFTVAFGEGAGTDFELGDSWTFDVEFWTEVTVVPTATMEYQVNYVDGDVLFHSADASKSVQASYEGRGSLVDAEDVNQIIDILNAGEIAIRNVDTSVFAALDCIGVDTTGYIEANATDGTKPALGFVKTVDDTEGEIVTFGPLAGFVGLTPGAVYYLAATDGGITATAPATPGNAQQKVGRAMSATTLFVRISDEVVVVS